MPTSLSSILGTTFVGDTGPQGFSGISGYSGFSGSGISGYSGTSTAEPTLITTGTFGNTSFVPVITVAANGRITNVVNTAISGVGVDQFARNTANVKTTTYYQNTAPITANNTGDLWVNSADGVVYENFGNTSNPVWAEFGPTGALVGFSGFSGFSGGITTGKAIAMAIVFG